MKIKTALNFAGNMKDKSIAEFVEWLESFSRDGCPDKYYRAWKILILKTTEYRDNSSEFSDLNWAYEQFKNDSRENKLPKSKIMARI